MIEHACRGPGLVLAGVATAIVAAPLVAAPQVVLAFGALGLVPAALWVARVEERVIRAQGGR